MRLLSESELKTVSGGFAPAAPAISSIPNETTTPPAQPLPQPQLVGPGLSLDTKCPQPSHNIVVKGPADWPSAIWPHPLGARGREMGRGGANHPRFLNLHNIGFIGAFRCVTDA